ncbi:hypothetical protein EFW17_07505 [Halostreptopolyspora alba]|uniref:Uncharacterized protein n=1 Tax=Halostreptopolyspora alba TaxID=2487137 RepID=A0A3N0ED78_9ACTN|nr:hypothetical protein EFW17_07505 [Nocardiopsaceae bacterium YIM 96095]
MIAKLRSMRGFDHAQQALTDSAQTALEAMLPSVPSEPARPLVERAVQRITSPILSRRVLLGKYQRWYGGHSPAVGQDDSIETLIDLSHWAHHSDNPDARVRIDDLLCRAFLADLREFSPQGRRARTWALDSVIVLDNVDTEIGRRLLDHLGRAGAWDPGEPLMVVAGSRGGLLRGEPHHDIGEANANGEEETDYQHNRVGSSSAKWLRYRLPDLTLEDVQALMRPSGLSARADRRLFRAVHQLTGGHPGSVAALISTADRHRPQSSDLGKLLDSRGPAQPPEPPPPPLEERLIADLLGPQVQDDRIEDLVTCSAARTYNEALRLAADSDLVGPLRTELDLLSVVDLWGRSTGAGQALLRRLLLRRLAARGHESGGTAEKDNPGWSKVHGRLRDYARTRHDTSMELYYALANGDLEFVERALAQPVAMDSPDSWLRLLSEVTSAPGDWPPHSRKTPIQQRDTVTHRCTRMPDPPSIPVARLVAALWVGADPLCGLERKHLHEGIALDYRTIAHSRATVPVELLREADRHEELARLWS